MDTMLHVGQARDAVVFVPSPFPVEKELKTDYIQEFLSRKTFQINEKFGKALAHMEGCSVNVAFVMNDFVRSIFPSLLAETRKMESLPIKFLKASVLIDGLDTVVLGIHIQQNIGKLAILAKDMASAQKLMKLYRIWNKQLLENTEASYSQDPLAQAMDSMDMYFQALKPTCKGNLIWWDEDAFRKNFSIVSQANFVPMAIAGVTIGLMMPAVYQARKTALKTHSMNYFHQATLAMLTYEMLARHFPLPYTIDEEGKPLHSWRVAILPYLEQNVL